MGRYVVCVCACLYIHLTISMGNHVLVILRPLRMTSWSTFLMLHSSTLPLGVPVRTSRSHPIESKAENNLSLSIIFFFGCGHSVLP